MIRPKAINLLDVGITKLTESVRQFLSVEAEDGPVQLQRSRIRR